MAVRKAGTVQSPLDTILQQLQTSQQQIQAANLAREQEIRAITDEIIARYQPGGAFQKAALGQLATLKVSDVGAGMQRLIASGMAGTEAAGGLETGWEQAVGAPARLKLEDLMMERLSQAQIGKAGFIERIEQPYPDFGTIAQLAGQAGQAESTRYAADVAARQATEERSRLNLLESRRRMREFFGEGEYAPSGGPSAPPPAEPWTPSVPVGGRYPTTAPAPQMIMPSTIYGAAYKGGAPTVSPKQMAETALPSTIYGTPTRGISQAGMPGLPRTPSAPTANILTDVRKAKTWEEVQAIAKMTGGRAGTEREWQAARRYY